MNLGLLGCMCLACRFPCAAKLGFVGCITHFRGVDDALCGGWAGGGFRCR